MGVKIDAVHFFASATPGSGPAYVSTCGVDTHGTAPLHMTVLIRVNGIVLISRKDNGAIVIHASSVLS